jgi:NAD-dependent dihydropyrimidine dehydrogenase PreA subunit
MKNSNDSLKEKAIRANELKNVSGGSQGGGKKICVIDEVKCKNYTEYYGCYHDCIDFCPVNGAIIDKGTFCAIDPNLCDGCMDCELLHCDAIRFERFN